MHEGEENRGRDKGNQISVYHFLEFKNGWQNLDSEIMVEIIVKMIV